MFLYAGGMPGDRIGIWALAGPELEATPLGEARGLHSPSFLCAHPRLPLLYAAERRWSAEEQGTGAVSVFAIDPATGQLALVSRFASEGAFTAHVGLSGDGRFLAVANPRGPNIAVWRLDDNGQPLGPPQVISHSGRGATPRQAEPWPHSAFFTPGGLRLLACDLALDRVFIHDVRPDREGAWLAPAPQGMVQVSSGAGARHLAQSADGRFFYVANELDSTVSVFGHDAESDCFAIVQTLPTTDPGFVGENQPAEIVLTPDGQHLLVTNRGADTLARFRVDGQSGRLRPLDQVPVLGESPRHVALDRHGRTMAVCNQKSDAIRLFGLQGSAQPQATPAAVPFGNPTCAVLWSPE